MIEALQLLNTVGWVHSNLRLENILVGDQNSSEESIKQLKLTSFSMSTSVYDNYGNHIKNYLKPLEGNIAFSTKNTIMGIVPSRRDDMISLVYILLYMLTGSLEFLSIKMETDTFERIAYLKHISSPESISKNE